VRPGAYPRVEHLKDASLGKALALLTNIRLGWIGFPGTNTLAYYKNYGRKSLNDISHLNEKKM
jgi:hypothetical protein